MGHCYNEGLKANPELEGQVQVKFVIDRQGKSGNVTDQGSTLPDPATRDCVLKTFDGLWFPAPEEGVVTVAYPVLLRPKE